MRWKKAWISNHSWHKSLVLNSLGACVIALAFSYFAQKSFVSVFGTTFVLLSLFQMLLREKRRNDEKKLARHAAIERALEMTENFQEQILLQTTQLSPLILPQRLFLERMETVRRCIVQVFLNPAAYCPKSYFFIQMHGALEDIILLVMQAQDERLDQLVREYSAGIQRELNV